MNSGLFFTLKSRSACENPAKKPSQLLLQGKIRVGSLDPEFIQHYTGHFIKGFLAITGNMWCDDYIRLLQ